MAIYGASTCAGHEGIGDKGLSKVDKVDRLRLHHQDIKMICRQARLKTDCGAFQ
mgnify:CR=1 FL=1